MSFVPPPSEENGNNWVLPRQKAKPQNQPASEALSQMGAEFASFSSLPARDWKAVEVPAETGELLATIGQGEAERIAKALKAGTFAPSGSLLLHAGRDPVATRALWELCKWADPVQASHLFVLVMGHTFGNKAANLMLLDIALSEMAGPRARVPEMFAVSHRDVALFLDHHIPDWTSLDPTQRAEKIQKVFDRFPNEAIDGLGLSVLVDGWKRKGWTAMVRSTGREDSAETANAGGNTSVANVACQKTAMASAMGKVIASYFSSHSLSQQRMLVGEVDQEPFVPVLIQRMIGEPAHAQPDQIPISGVLFSQEVQGPTPEVVMVQASFGHGEGVVTGEIPCDSYYLLNGEHYSAIRGKPYRVAPAGHKGTELQENPSILWDRPSLSPELLRQLEAVGRHLQRVYGGPIDAEFVIEQGQLYVVQARPIVSRPPETATFVDLSSATSVGFQRLRMTECTVSAGQKVVAIEDPSQLVVAQTLAGALAKALQRRDQGLITKAVVVQESAGVLSHWATSFREMGIPVLVGPDPKAHLQPGSVLIIDPQRTSLWIGVGDATGVIRKGTIRHPVPAVLSEMEPSDDPACNIGGALGAQRDSFIDLGTSWDLESLLDAIGDTTQPERLKEAYAVLSSRLQRHAGRLKEGGASQQVLDGYLALCRRIEYLGWRALVYLQGADRNIGRVVPLMASWVAALLTQKGSETLGGSIAQILHAEKVPPVIADEGMRIGIQKIWAKAGMADRLDEISQAIMALKSVVIDPDLQEQWQEITCELLRRGPKYANGVLECVQDLQKLHLLVPMLSGPITKAVRLRPVREAVQALLEQVAEALPHLHRLVQSTRDLRLRIMAAKQSLPSWTELEGFEERWRGFESRILQPASDLLPILSSINELERIQASHLLAEITDLTDSVIKTVKGNDALPVELRYERVRLMVEQLQLLSVAATQQVMRLPRDQTLSVDGRFWESNRNRIASPLGYLEVWSNAYKGLCDEMNLTSDHRSFLDPSQFFNVASAVFTAATNPEREVGRSYGTLQLRSGLPATLPKGLLTLDDAFTLAHQNLLAACRLVDHWTQHCVQSLPFESQFLIMKQGSGHLSGVHCTADEVSVDLAVPLQNHAGHLRFTQPRDASDLKVELSLFGHNIGQRWRRLTDPFQAVYPGARAVVQGPSVAEGMEDDEAAMRAPHTVDLTIQLRTPSISNLEGLSAGISHALRCSFDPNLYMPRPDFDGSIDVHPHHEVLRAIERRLLLIGDPSASCSAETLKACYAHHEGTLSPQEHLELVSVALTRWIDNTVPPSLDRLWADPRWLSSVGKANPAALATDFASVLRRPLALEPLSSEELQTQLARLQSLIPPLQQAIQEGSLDYVKLVPLLQNDPTLALAAIRRDPRSIRFLKEECPELLTLSLEAIRLDRTALQYVHPRQDILDNPTILEAVKLELHETPNATQTIPTAFLQHPEIIKYALQNGYWWVLTNGGATQFDFAAQPPPLPTGWGSPTPIRAPPKAIPDELWQRPDVAEAVERSLPSLIQALADGKVLFQQLPTALLHLPAVQKIHRQMVLTALHADPSSICYADPSLAQDQEILSLIQPQIADWMTHLQRPGRHARSPFWDLPTFAQAVHPVVMSAIEHTDPLQLKELYQSLKTELQLDEEIAEAIAKQDRAALRYLTPPVQALQAVQLAAARLSYTALKLLPADVANSREFVEAAVPSLVKLIGDKPPAGDSMPGWMMAIPKNLLQHPMVISSLCQWSFSYAGSILRSRFRENLEQAYQLLVAGAAEAILENPDRWPEQWMSPGLDTQGHTLSSIQGDALTTPDYKEKLENTADMIVHAAYFAITKDPSIRIRLPGWVQERLSQ
ncbi:MAG: PEP/pyruvate-binding domain-containing protein [Chlamydiia bacterium]